MKTLKIITCVTIIVASLVYAGTTKIDFNLAGLTGQLKTKGAAIVTETNGWISFTGMGTKDQVIITAASAVKGVHMDGGKLIKQKGKITGNIESIVIATAAPDITNPNNIVTTLAGNDKFTVKLKGVNVGTIIAKTMKMVLVNDINGAVGGTTAKGVKIMTQDGDIAGDAMDDALVGGYDYAVGGVEQTIPVETKIKTIKAKKGAIGYVDAMNATAAKPGKTKWIAKVPSVEDVLVTPGQFDVAKSLKKNVILKEVP